jgi:hypothetical protein
VNRPSPVQADALARMDAGDGTIVRVAGGFWTTPDTPRHDTVYGPVPEWYVSIQTVRAMELRGWVERTGAYEEEWRDTRRLTR